MFAIYGLADPKTLRVRYVGRTRNLVARFTALIKTAPRNENIRRHDWIRRLASRGQRPVMVLLDSCRNDEAADAEARWIAHYRRRGHIFNVLDRSILLKFKSKLTKAPWVR